METIENLIKLSVDAYEKAPTSTRVSPAIPIPYFGDIYSCMQSPIRIVTVGINPSSAEFPEENPFHRFSSAINTDPNNIEIALSRYFKDEPYKSWFKYYEVVLNGFNASYYGNPP